MARCRIICAAAALMIAVAPAHAQSLGELARQEEARRATSKSVKTLSNSDLRPGEVFSPASSTDSSSPAATCYMSIRLGRCVTAEEMVANSTAGNISRENAPFEQRWRQDADALRSQIEKTQRSIATLEGVVADAGRSGSDRKAAQQALAAAQQALVGFERKWQKLEQAAGLQKIPRAWIEPIPTLSTR